MFYSVKATDENYTSENWGDIMVRRPHPYLDYSASSNHLPMPCLRHNNVLIHCRSCVIKYWKRRMGRFASSFGLDETDGCTEQEMQSKRLSNDLVIEMQTCSSIHSRYDKIWVYLELGLMCCS